jgi:hypothetical protein
VQARAGSWLVEDLGWPVLGEEGKEEEKKLTGGIRTSVRERAGVRARPSAGELGLGEKREKDRVEGKERGVGDGPPGKGAGPRGRREKLGCRKEGMGCRADFSFLSTFLFFLKLTQFYLNSNEIGIQT